MKGKYPCMTLLVSLSVRAVVVWSAAPRGRSLHTTVAQSSRDDHVNTGRASITQTDPPAQQSHVMTGQSSIG